MANTIDLTPDPKVLIALTHTPLRPLDALCELIDNSLDSFQTAVLKGNPVTAPQIIIELPKKNEIEHNEGIIRLRDNGPGMDAKMAERALKAGYSANNPYDSLGLFGMGFNISTGKLGRVTKLITCTKESDKAIEVTVDLEEMVKAKSFHVPVKLIEKPENFTSGTVIEISNWWPEGNPNNGFVTKLISYGLPKIRQELGRIYGTFLRHKSTQIVLKGEKVEPFEHCVWDKKRFVETKKHGQINAQYHFSHSVGTQTRCSSCYFKIESGLDKCPVCESTNLRSIEEVIKGWVGVQRYDDITDYGIDLIRNGRCIRVGEKQAFFEYVDGLKRVIKDYPIDQQQGRIVGEVHLNFVPVDFMKQDFQRSSPEWNKAMVFLRGESSLQPTQEGADKNHSYLYKLYQGYRKVRKAGKEDMYMGYFDNVANGPKRISREIEKEYLDKFNQKLSGYYDDEKWWELVKTADTPPLNEFINCPSCTNQNSKEADECLTCGHILRPKVCINEKCKTEIPLHARSCPKCGFEQSYEVKKKWKCFVCGNENAPEKENCVSCNSERGKLDPISEDYLLSNSDIDDELSIPSCSIVLADDKYSRPIKVTTHISRTPILPYGKKESIPLIFFKKVDAIDVFADVNHAMFKTYQVKLEESIATEVSLLVYEFNRSLTELKGMHTLTSLQWQIMRTYWSQRLEISPAILISEINDFFKDLKKSLRELCDGLQEEIFNDLDNEEQKDLFSELMKNNVDVMKMEKLKNSGAYLDFIDPIVIAKVFKKYPDRFFDGRFWNVPFKNVPNFADSVLFSHQQKITTIYSNCLTDIVTYLRWNDPDPALNKRANAALQFVKQKRP